MSATTTVPTSTKWPNYIAWALQILLALAFLAAGVFKLAGAAPMVQIFDQIGMGQWFRIVTGLVEIVGAVGLLMPGFAGPAALWLGFEMLCAIGTHLAVLHTNPAPAVALFVISGVIAYLRRQQITALLGRR